MVTSEDPGPMKNLKPIAESDPAITGWGTGRANRGGDSFIPV